ncbi:MAG: hypothetical protein AAFV80_17745, partial [Bacteroidota bacterium]
YKKPMESLRDSLSDLKYEQLEEKTYINDFTFQIADHQIHLSHHRVIDYGTAIDWTDSTAFIILGTIGADLLEGNVIALDFPNNTCSLYPHLPEGIQQIAKMEPFDFRGRRILLPGKVNGKKNTFMYDSGSSTFELITSEQLFHQYAIPGAAVDTFKINTWGTKINGYQTLSTLQMEFAQTGIKAERTTYLDWPNKVQALLMRFSGMGGMIGNKIFVNHTLVLDGTNSTFGLMD